MFNKYSLKTVIILQKAYKIDAIGTAQAHKWYTCLYNNQIAVDNKLQPLRLENSENDGNVNKIQALVNIELLFSLIRTFCKE